jgi:hypothetical protein
LNATAQYLSQGYVPEASMTIIEDHYSELQHEKELEMEQLLGAFFPAPHRSGRRRQSGDGTDDAMHKPQHVCGGSTVAAFLDLVAQEQLIVKNRHRLFLMPTRG